MTDGETTNGTNESSEFKLTLFAEPPASDDVNIINRIRVNQVIEILGTTLTSEEDKQKFSSTTSSLLLVLMTRSVLNSSTNTALRLFSAEGGAGAFKARHFIEANISAEGLEGDKAELEKSINTLSLQSAIAGIDVKDNSVVLQLDPTSWTGKHTVESGASGDGYQFTLSADGNWNLAITGPAADAYNPQNEDSTIYEIFSRSLGNDWNQNPKIATATTKITEAKASLNANKSLSGVNDSNMQDLLAAINQILTA